MHQHLKNPGPDAPLEPIFEKKWNLYETCAGMSGLHVAPPLQTSICTHVPPKSRSKALLRRGREKGQQKTAQSAQNDPKTEPK